MLKEKTEAERVLLVEVTEDLTEIRRHVLVIEKVLSNLETKFSRLESTNDKLIEAYEQNNDNEGAEKFQNVLDKESELIDGILDKISQLKVLKRELEQRRQGSDGRHEESLGIRAEAQVRQMHPPEDITSSLSQQMYGPIKPPQLKITPFSGDVLKWKEFGTRLKRP